MRSLSLRNSSYTEKTVSVITPAFAIGGIGTHHFHSNGRMTVFDFATFTRVKSCIAVLIEFIRPLVPKAIRTLGLRIVSRSYASTSLRRPPSSALGP